MPDGTLSILIAPPARYLDQPYSGKVDMRIIPPAAVENVCTDGTGRFENVACTQPMETYCLILIADNLSPELTEAVKIHELAHCSGWGADHPLD